MTAFTRNPAHIPDQEVGGSTVRQAVADQNSAAIDALFLHLNTHTSNNECKTHAEIDEKLASIEEGFIGEASELVAAAEAAKTAAEAAKTAAETAKTGAETAKTGAETAKTGAETAEGLAEKWATEVEDAVVANEKYSALHHAAKAADFATAAETAKTAAEAAKTAAEAVAAGGSAARYLFHAGDGILTLKSGYAYEIGDTECLTEQTVITVSSALDTSIITGGKDYSVYACLTDDDDIVYKVSLSEVAPSGYTAADSFRLGGFHTLCVAAGTLSQNAGMTEAHPLSGKVAGAILPASVWDRSHRPRNCKPSGMVYSERLDWWCDIYLTSGTGSETASEYGATHSVSRNFGAAQEDFRAVGKEFLSDEQFVEFSIGSNQETTITGAKDWTTVGGHVDTANRRMVSVYGCEETCGYLWQHLKAWGGGDSAGWVSSGTGLGSYCGCHVLLAGGGWDHGSDCGSLARYGGAGRSGVNANLGGRGGCQPLHRK